MLTTGDVADLLNVRRSWVREHAAEFGAIRLGTSDRGEFRFDPDRVDEAIEARRLERPPVRRERQRPGPVRGVLGGRIPASAKEW